jgi:hypothetical protein
MSKEKSAPKKKAGKPAAKKPVSEKTPEEILCGEIAEVCKLLDAEGLMFIKRQADVLLHNSRVEKLRQEALEKAAAQGPEDAAPAAVPARPAPIDRSVKVEQTGSVTFNIHVGKKRVFFNKDEMRAITKICHAAGDDAEGGRRLFAWFKKERGDFLVDTETGSASSPVLSELRALIVRTYKVKE